LQSPVYKNSQFSFFCRGRGGRNFPEILQKVSTKVLPKFWQNFMSSKFQENRNTTGHTYIHDVNTFTILIHCWCLLFEVTYSMQCLPFIAMLGKSSYSKVYIVVDNILNNNFYKLYFYVINDCISIINFISYWLYYNLSYNFRKLFLKVLNLKINEIQKIFFSFFKAYVKIISFRTVEDDETRPTKIQFRTFNCYYFK